MSSVESDTQRVFTLADLWIESLTFEKNNKNSGRIEGCVHTARTTSPSPERRDLSWAFLCPVQTTASVLISWAYNLILSP